MQYIGNIKNKGNLNCVLEVNTCVEDSVGHPDQLNF